jgi:hypothetical protein
MREQASKWDYVFGALVVLVAVAALSFIAGEQVERRASKGDIERAAEMRMKISSGEYGKPPNEPPADWKPPEGAVVPAGWKPK